MCVLSLLVLLRSVLICSSHFPLPNVFKFYSIYFSTYKIKISVKKKNFFFNFILLLGISVQRTLLQLLDEDGRRRVGGWRGVEGMVVAITAVQLLQMMMMQMTLKSRRSKDAKPAAWTVFVFPVKFEQEEPVETTDNNKLDFISFSLNSLTSLFLSCHRLHYIQKAWKRL